jgi:hypothetical protein
MYQKLKIWKAVFSYQLEGMGREEDWPGEPRRRKRKFQTKCSNSQSLNIELNEYYRLVTNL